MTEKSRDELKRIELEIERAATLLAHDLRISDSGLLAHNLFEAWIYYAHKVTTESQSDLPSKVSADLIKVAKASDALSIELQSLCHQGRSFLISMGSELAKSNPEAAQIVDFEGLPSSRVCFPYGDEPEPPSRWIERLNWLACMAENASAFIKERSANTGRRNLWSRIHGSSQDDLAKDCMRIAESHGHPSQAVALKLMHVVMEVEHGKEAMKKIDGKPSKDKGRKAVRKLAQTKPKTGTV